MFKQHGYTTNKVNVIVLKKQQKVFVYPKSNPCFGSWIKNNITNVVMVTTQT